MSQPRMFENLFLSVGAMKAGTTWLYAVLNRHPALHFTPEKELHYFYHRYVDPTILGERRRLHSAKNRYLHRFDPNNANLDRIRQNLHWVSNYLSRPVDDHWYRNLFQMHGQQQWACDFSNLHALLPSEAWPQIEAKCQNLKVLYTLRDPVKRLWSHTKFHVQITGKMEEMESWGPGEYYAFAKQPFIFNNSEYGTALRRLTSGLSPENLKVICYENLHANQRDTLRQIENFLGIKNFDYPQAILDRRPNESSKIQMPDFFPELFAKDVERIKEELQKQGYQVPDSWL